MKLVTSNESTSAFADKVSKLVEDAKHNTQWRKQFMDFKHYMSQSFNQGKEVGLQEGIQQGLQQGVQQGAQQKVLENARSFLAMKVLSPEQIAQGTGLPLEQILELQKQITVQA